MPPDFRWVGSNNRDSSRASLTCSRERSRSSSTLLDWFSDRSTATETAKQGPLSAGSDGKRPASRTPLHRDACVRVPAGTELILRTPANTVPARAIGPTAGNRVPRVRARKTARASRKTCASYLTPSADGGPSVLPVRSLLTAMPSPERSGATAGQLSCTEIGCPKPCPRTRLAPSNAPDADPPMRA